MEYLSYSTIIQQYPLPKESFRNQISTHLAEHKFKIIILDDDPTGIQTVHNCFLITKCTSENLQTAFDDKAPFFYILTNSRSLDPEKAKKINEDVVSQVLALNQTYHYKLIFISRSDSTLRGHFPLEPETIRKILKLKGHSVNLPTFFIPSFLEVGRFTINNVHYIRDIDNLIPVSETEFARDNVFGYQNSNLADYIIEKSKNRLDNTQIKSISLHELHTKNVDELAEIIESTRTSAYVIVNALHYFDLQKFALTFLQLLSKGNEIGLLRTSSSFPKAVSGIEDKSLLTKQELLKIKSTGIFVVGSHVRKTTVQMEKLLTNSRVKGIELHANEIINTPDTLFMKTLKELDDTVKQGLTPVVYTSREEIRLVDKNARLEVGQKISAFIVRVVRNLPFIPAYMVAKGGITSNDILSDGLNIEIAKVMGQILTGIPVIMTTKDNHYPDLPYIIFPGNVGDENSLLHVFEKLN